MPAFLALLRRVRILLLGTGVLLLGFCGHPRKEQHAEPARPAAAPADSGHVDAPVEHATATGILQRLQESLDGLSLNGRADHDFAHLALEYTHAGLDLANLTAERSTSDSLRALARRVRPGQERLLPELEALTSRQHRLHANHRLDPTTPFARATATMRRDLRTRRAALPASPDPAGDLAAAWQIYAASAARLAQLELRYGQDPRLREIARLLRPVGTSR
ncbi:hypothetical protein [Hymenobacter psychrotolerans]|uniref:Uncharacterized protein n=1 Tax=Hymenobacter psychrotolerans DSM 18569 TaxID=1121959 RepID=A0A1M6ZR72_9BACT|nr:hypothetical protein [Hymenobacter psychrotolerans]SHL32889.1 protein of unknown function [Hymenobacter psychrotolerans DSM 18569]